MSGLARRGLGGVRLRGSRADRALPWRRVPFACIDLETTGLDPRYDALVSFGVIPVADGRVRLDRGRYRLVHPGRPMPPHVVTIHRIRPADLAEAPPLDAVEGELRDSLRDAVPVAWTSWVEAAFLARALGGSARAWEHRIVDVRRLVIAVDHLAGVEPSPAARESLAATSERYGVPPDLEHHALWDAFVTAQLFLICASRLEAAGRGTVGDLVRLGRGRRLGEVLRPFRVRALSPRG